MARIPAAQRRQEFIDATVQVIAEHGIADTTTRRIAEAADAPLASLHYCFNGKDELFHAAFASQAAMLGERIGPAAKGSGMATTAVNALRSSIDWYLEDRSRAQAIQELELWAWRNTDVASAAEVFDVYIGPLSANLRRSARPGDDPELAEPAARLVNVLADGLLLQWCAYRDDARLRSDAERACEMIARYLTPTTGPEGGQGGRAR